MKKSIFRLSAICFIVVSCGFGGACKKQETVKFVDGDPYTLNIASFNIGQGRFCEYDMKKIAKIIRSKNIEVVGLQEVDVNCARSNYKDLLKDLKKATGFKYSAFLPVQMIGSEGYMGNAVLSKYPIKEEETENIKLPSSSSMPRKLGKVTIDVGEYFFPFFVTHLSYEEKQARTKQFEKISSILAEYDDYILVGDFNTTDFSEYEIITNANTVFSPTLTLPTHGETCIDNIVYSPVGWSFTPPETVQNNASDHNMVYSTATYLLK